MGKICVEVCLISARGLQRASSLFKLQWYAIGWIDSKDKYCTKIDASGNANPIWKSKFSTMVDYSASNVQDLAINIEVYSREPIFLRERLQGTATVVLKEFLDKFVKSSGSYKPVEEVGSFQLRKKKSNKPQGFIDVSIRVSEEREDPNIYSGDNGGVKLMNYNNGINLAAPNKYVSSQGTQPKFLPTPLHHLESQQPPSNPSYTQPALPPTAHPYAFQGGPSYQLAGGSAYPPPPPSNIGYVPSFLQTTQNASSSYIHVSSSGTGRGRGGAAFGMGLGTGALAAGAVISGENFTSGFSIPSGSQNASLNIATDLF